MNCIILMLIIDIVYVVKVIPYFTNLLYSIFENITYLKMSDDSDL